MCEVARCEEVQRERSEGGEQPRGASGPGFPSEIRAADGAGADGPADQRLCSAATVNSMVNFLYVDDSSSSDEDEEEEERGERETAGQARAVVDARESLAGWRGRLGLRRLHLPPAQSTPRRKNRSARHSRTRHTLPQVTRAVAHRRSVAPSPWCAMSLHCFQISGGGRTGKRRALPPPKN